ENDSQSHSRNLTSSDLPGKGRGIHSGERPGATSVGKTAPQESFSEAPGRLRREGTNVVDPHAGCPRASFDLHLEEGRADGLGDAIRSPSYRVEEVDSPSSAKRAHLPRA